MIDTIIVPRGSEYNSVCRGLSPTKNNHQPQVISIPLGIKSLSDYLWQQPIQGKNVLMMGVCGSISPDYGVGDIVIYEDCFYQEQSYPCDPFLTRQLQQQLGLPLVRGLSSDRLIVKAQEKSHLNQLYQAQVVDMEGFAALNILQQQRSAVAMIRVVSDDCDYDLPNLEKAIAPDGNLKPLPLASAMIRQPLAAMRLIRGSLIALRKLEGISSLLG